MSWAYVSRDVALAVLKAHAGPRTAHLYLDEVDRKGAVELGGVQIERGDGRYVLRDLDLDSPDILGVLRFVGATSVKASDGTWILGNGGQT